MNMLMFLSALTNDYDKPQPGWGTGLGAGCEGCSTLTISGVDSFAAFVARSVSFRRPAPGLPICYTETSILA